MERDNLNRPKAFNMSIQGGMLESLGVNMYTSIAQSLVEFVANSYDSDATGVTISLPHDRIEKIKTTNFSKTKFLDAILPENLEIVIEDDGHGMSPDEVQEKFLPINRNRRKDQLGDEIKNSSESGKRTVMGRKGLGKLAGFGTAEKITVETKRKGEKDKIIFCLDYKKLSVAPDFSQHLIDATYEPDDINKHGTKIVLSNLKYGSVKSSMEMIKRTILRNFFGMDSKEFAIMVKNTDIDDEKQNTSIAFEEAIYEYYYPKINGCPNINGDFATEIVKIKDIKVEFEFSYVIKFRARKGDSIVPQDTHQDRYGPLLVKMKGARVYCNNRLAMGPTLFDLSTSIPYYLGHSYMECIVVADALDREFSDLISTNRTELKDNEVTKAFFKIIETRMRDALYENGKHREKQAEKTIRENPKSKIFFEILKEVPTKQQKSSLSILKVIAAGTGVESEAFKTIAPLLMKSVNAGTILVKLNKLQTNPKSISEIAYHLDELREIEIQDMLKIARGKRKGINALEKFQAEGYKKVKGKAFEDEFHSLLSKNPWLIKAEYTNYLTSNQPETSLIKEMEYHLGINKDKDFYENQKKPDGNKKRPDLVFLMSDSSEPHFIDIVELKSPNKFMDIDDLNQLEGYISDIGRYLKNRNNTKSFAITGHLIGKIPSTNTKNREQLILLDKIEASGAREKWEVVGLDYLISRAKKSYSELIDALLKYEKKNR